MERKGKCLYHNPVCLVLITGHGHARRRSWMSGLGCSASTYSMASWTRRKRRSRPITSPHTTPGHPRAHIRTMVLLRRTTEAPPHGRVGRVGIDLHLGQKLKLGGRYADDSLIYISYFVGPLYIHVLLSLLLLLLFLLSKTQKDQKYFRCFSLFAFLVFYLWFCFTCYFRFAVWKIQKYFALFAISFVLVSKIEKPKIFVVLLRFCKVCCRVQSLVTPLEPGIHFILFKPHKWRAIMMTYDNPRCGKRLV
jgi:hypothetical protein